MNRRMLVLLGVAALLVLPTGFADAQNAPNGWVRAPAWNFLAPLNQSYGSAGGPYNPGNANEDNANFMLGNWVAPHDIATEDPQAGDNWSDIDFGGAAQATGFTATQILPAPIWFTTTLLTGAGLTLPAGWDTNDVIDYQGLVDHLNTQIPVQDPPLPTLPGDNVLAIATTYVENLTDAPLPVEICSASDDSIQVWVNNNLVTNRSIPRGTAGNCAELRPAVLPVGVSKVVAMVFEGGGGWGLRFGIHVNGVRQDDTSTSIKYLGPVGTGQVQYSARRSQSRTLAGCYSDPRTISIVGSGPGDEGDVLEVVENFSGDPATVQLSSVSTGGSVVNTIASDSGIDVGTGGVLQFFVLGPIANAGAAAPGVDLIRAEYLSIADADVNTLNEGDTVNDVDGVARTVQRIAVNNGDALDFNVVEGDVDNIMHYAWTQLVLTEAKRVVVGGGSDDSVQFLVDGVEVAIHNEGSGFGGVGEIQDFRVSPVLDLAAGTHTILAKVYEGGGGHGVRVVILEAPAGDVGAGSEDCTDPTPIAPGQYGVGSTKGAPLGLVGAEKNSGANYYLVEGTGGSVTVQTCGRFLYDTYLAAFTGDCAAPGDLVENDDTCGRQSQITFNTVAGTDYIVQVCGWDNREGPYVVKVSDDANPASAVDFTPLIGSGVCADPDGDCDTEAETITAQKIVWNVTRGELNAGVSYVLESPDLTQGITITGYVTNEAGTGGVSEIRYNRFVEPVGPFDVVTDVGIPPTPGTMTLAGDEYTMFGSGQDIWGTRDDFLFAFKEVTGDFRITMRVTERSLLPDGNGWGRHGPIARYDCHFASKFFMPATLFESPAGAINVPSIERRVVTHTGGVEHRYQVSDGTFPTEGRLPTWMRMERIQNTLYSYLAEDADDDGQPDSWCAVGSDSDNNMPETLLVGVANQGRLPAGATLKFDNLSIEPIDVAPSGCSADTELAAFDFEQADGTAPEGSRVAVGGSTFTPQILGGRLRLTDEAIAGSATAVWYGGDASLAENGFVVEFDAFMTRDTALGNPADGMTFAVAQGDPSTILGACDPTGLDTPAEDGFDTSVFVGTDNGGVSASSYDAGVYTNASSSSMDLWDGGDHFQFDYAELTGDFDVAIEIVSYSHNVGSDGAAGRWGKFGLIARQTLGTCGRYTMAQAHGPDTQDAARQAGRLDYDPSCGNMYEDAFGGAGAIPRFLRLTRRGNVFQGFASNHAGLADGTLDPTNDCNWAARGRMDDWGASAPAAVYLGFANSEHNSDPDVDGSGNPATQTVQYRILAHDGGGIAGGAATGYVGGTGGALGYEGGQIRDRFECIPSFAVELDNWVGGGNPANEPADGGSTAAPYSYHFGLDQNSDVSSAQTNVDLGVPTDALPDIFNPEGIRVEVAYSPTGHVDVYASGLAKDGVTAVPRTQVLSYDIAPLAGPIVLGFTGGTGGATCTQEVDNVVLSSACCEDPDSVSISGPDEVGTGEEFTLTADFSGAEGAVTYAWTITKGQGSIQTQGQSVTITAEAEGELEVKVEANDEACAGLAVATKTVTVITLGGLVKPMDMNGDGQGDLSDAVALLNHLFLGADGPPCAAGNIADAANVILLDANGDATVDLSDAVTWLNFLFLGGRLPEMCTDGACAECILIPDCPDLCP